MTSKAKFRMNLEMHSGQLEVRKGILHSKARIIEVVGSRGWGKSIWVTGDIVAPALMSKPNRQILYVAPYYKHCKSVVDDVWFGVNEHTNERFIPDKCPDTNFRFWQYRKADMELHTYHNSIMYIRSADNPDSIVSKGFNVIVVDEAALINEKVWQQHILPTARRQDCVIVLISSPRGKNWFYRMHLRGQDPSQPNYISFRQPWWKRPDYPDLLKEEMKNLPERIRQQEFEAMFVDDAGGTFANLDHIFWGESIEFDNDQQEWEHPDIANKINDQECVLALDVAKQNDYTVCFVLTLETREIVKYWRMNKADYKVVIDRVHRTAKDMNDCDIIYDATGVGLSFGDFLSADFNCHPFTFTNKSKNELINQLIVASEYNHLNVPNIQTVRNEMEIFEFQVTRTGAITYNAPAGYHDDCVVSLAMANWYANETGGSMEVREIDNFLSVVNNDEPKDFYEFMENDND